MAFKEFRNSFQGWSIFVIMKARAANILYAWRLPAVLMCCSVSVHLAAQEPDTLWSATPSNPLMQERKLGSAPGGVAARQPAEADFLFNYYDQEGKHSAVTGGTGTEALTDRAFKMTVHIPTDSATRVFAGVHFNHYSSASTDRINPQLSTASAVDSRVAFHAGWTRHKPSGQNSVTIEGGASMESDYVSAWGSVEWSRESRNKNRSLTIRGKSYFDTWLIIFPDELRGPTQSWVKTDRRYSFSLETAVTQVLHKRLHFILMPEAVYQTGLLSTPFHRVYFRGDTLARVEKLPDSRFKFPVGMRLHYFAGSRTVFRLYYRFYRDDYNMTAHTVQLEVPFKLTSSVTISPFYRYHTQTAATWFAPYREHSGAPAYFTSDYDLSAFSSQKAGIGLKFAPAFGIGRFRSFRRASMFRAAELRMARYMRSDGLGAWLFSMGMNFQWW